MFADGFVKACVKLLDTTASRLSPQSPWRLPIVQHAAHRRYGSAFNWSPISAFAGASVGAVAAEARQVSNCAGPHLAPKHRRASYGWC